MWDVRFSPRTSLVEAESKQDQVLAKVPIESKQIRAVQIAANSDEETKGKVR
jgi:hypothetical protein